MKKKLRKLPIRYWSIKLPKDGLSYKDGMFPQYTKEYLRKRGQTLFEILMNHVPAEVYNEVMRQMQAREAKQWVKSTTTTHKSSQS
jgi:hypothetical protein